jgi:hypothetical protein
MTSPSPEPEQLLTRQYQNKYNLHISLGSNHPLEEDLDQMARSPLPDLYDVSNFIDYNNDTVTQTDIESVFRREVQDDHEYMQD